MLPGDTPSRLSACDRAHAEYLLAERRLLAKVDRAIDRRGPWPTPEEYEAAEALGRHSFALLREHLRAAGAASLPKRVVVDKVKFIQRLSAAERRWQPTPEDWLKLQDRNAV